MTNEQRTELVHAKTQELVADMAAGSDIFIGEFKYSPRQYVNRLIDDGCYPADIAILMFSKAEASFDRVEAWKGVSAVIEKWAEACIDAET